MEGKVLVWIHRQPQGLSDYFIKTRNNQKDRRKYILNLDIKACPSKVPRQPRNDPMAKEIHLNQWEHFLGLQLRIKKKSSTTQPNYSEQKSLGKLIQE